MVGPGEPVRWEILVVIVLKKGWKIITDSEEENYWIKYLVYHPPSALN